jgi:phosphoglycolate phosphatase-like HAD superfamily hydrolase
MIIPKTIKAIAWDLDGTLLNSFGIYSDILRRLAPTFGLPVPTSEMLLMNFHGQLHESINGTFGGLNDDTLKKFENQFLIEQNAYYVHIDQHLLEDAIILADKATAASLKQVIVTNRAHTGRDRASPRNIVEQSVLRQHIHHIICGDESGDYHKPDPRVFGDLFERWQIKPAELLVIGDQYVDAQLALNSGSRAIIVSREVDQPAHLDTLPTGWQNHVAVVKSLHSITFDA